MTRAEKLTAIAELTALKNQPVNTSNFKDWLQKVTAKIRRYFPETNIATEINRVFDPWISSDVDEKDKRRMTFQQVVDSVKGMLGSIVAQLQAEIDLHLNEDKTDSDK